VVKTLGADIGGLGIGSRPSHRKKPAWDPLWGRKGKKSTKSIIKLGGLSPGRNEKTSGPSRIQCLKWRGWGERNQQEARAKTMPLPPKT